MESQECQNQKINKLINSCKYKGTCCFGLFPLCQRKRQIVKVNDKAITCLNDFCPVALTSTIKKCFERVIKDYIISKLAPSFEPFQFAYQPNRSTKDVISTALHLSLEHLEEKNTYVRMLLLDFSSAFNTIISQDLGRKVGHLGLQTSLCNWLLDFLTNRTQSVSVSNNKILLCLPSSYSHESWPNFELL